MHATATPLAVAGLRDETAADVHGAAVLDPFARASARDEGPTAHPFQGARYEVGLRRVETHADVATEVVGRLRPDGLVAVLDEAAARRRRQCSGRQ
jgi:hypothetical protein